MHLTPDILEATYDWLRALPPFRRWKLPPGEEVEFGVLATADRFGDCVVSPDEVRIRVSGGKVKLPATLVRTMAHEMCHIRAFRQGESAEHGRRWRRAADQVCRLHGFDPKEF